MGNSPLFTKHDLQRTCRSLLAKQGTPGNVAERSLNHKLKGVERQEALGKLSETIAGIVD